MSKSRNMKLNMLNISELVSQLALDFPNWANKDLERLGDLVEFELMDRINRLEQDRKLHVPLSYLANPMLAHLTIEEIQNRAINDLRDRFDNEDELDGKIKSWNKLVDLEGWEEDE